MKQVVELKALMGFWKSVATMFRPAVTPAIPAVAHIQSADSAFSTYHHDTASNVQADVKVLTSENSAKPGNSFLSAGGHQFNVIHFPPEAGATRTRDSVSAAEEAQKTLLMGEPQIKKSEATSSPLDYAILPAFEQEAVDTTPEVDLDELSPSLRLASTPGKGHDEDLDIDQELMRLLAYMPVHSLEDFMGDETDARQTVVSPQLLLDDSLLGEASWNV